MTHKIWENILLEHVRPDMNSLELKYLPQDLQEEWEEILRRAFWDELIGSLFEFFDCRVVSSVINCNWIMNDYAKMDCIDIEI